MKIIANLLKDARDEWLVKTTASINEINPMVDRLMDDDSVESVIMTNNEGNPILTNVNLMMATNFGLGLHALGVIARRHVIDMDPFNEILVLRIKTKKCEMMMAPSAEFTIITVQHARQLGPKTGKKKKT